MKRESEVKSLTHWGPLLPIAAIQPQSKWVKTGRLHYRCVICRARETAFKDILNIFRWCPGAESNHRHEDFQSTALPTELPGQKRGAQREGRVLNPRTLHASSNARPDVRPVSIGSVLLRRCCQCRALPIDDSMPAARKSQVITLA